MSRAPLGAFLDEVRSMLQRSGGAQHPRGERARESPDAAVDRVLACGRELLDNPSVEALTAASAELDSAVRILRRRSVPVEPLVGLGSEMEDALLAAVTSEARRDLREYTHSVGERILSQLAGGSASPSELADQLDVEISQISRAAKTLRDDGLIEVRTAPGDRRRRIYRATSQDASVRRRRAWWSLVERLAELRAEDVRSDLLPGRVGDRLGAKPMAGICAAFRDDIESGRYEPTPAHEVDVPKTNGGVRPAAALRFADRLAYAALVERCRAEIEASLVSERTVLWPRGAKSDKQWLVLEGFVSDSDDTHVLSVDIQSFYDSIRHDILADALERAGCDQAVVSDLRAWLGEITGGRERGLPQGLTASDPLATVVLAPLDQALASAGVRFVRHGDDVRAVGSLTEVRDAARLVRDQLRSLELTINDDKTRVLRHATYMDRRNEVSGAVRGYLEASDRIERHSAIFVILDALGADVELSWSWYHDTLSVREVMESIGSPWDPSDTAALMIVLKEAAEAEEASARLAAKWATPRDPSGTVLVQTGIAMLAVAGALEPADELDARIVARPEYAGPLSSYIEATAPQNPSAVAGLLQRIDDTGETYGAQWLRFYEALGDAGEHGEFDNLARSHVDAADRNWMRRLRAARFMAHRDNLDTDRFADIAGQAPAALRDDVLSIMNHTTPQPPGALAKNEGATASALVTAAPV